MAIPSLHSFREHENPYRENGFLARLFCCALICLSCGSAGAADGAAEAPRIVAALEQGEAAERGIGGYRRPWLALAFYCDAGTMGSVEGYYRLGRLLRESHSVVHDPALGNAYLALAARLGHQNALAAHEADAADGTPLPDDCGAFSRMAERETFDLEAYLAALPLMKRKIAALISRHASRFDIDARFALAVALAESNLDPRAVSPKNAQGVMQLIPDTQERFGVRRPFDPESNIRGALTYLRWLAERFDGDMALVAAAYNAGEGMVERYNGIPPFPETRQYVRRVLYLSGFPQPVRKNY